MKKLALRREAIRTLTGPQLAGVLGGKGAQADSASVRTYDLTNCPSAVCNTSYTATVNCPTRFCISDTCGVIAV